MKFIPHIALALIAVVLVAADKKPVKTKPPTWLKIVNRKSGRCLAVEGGLKKDGASVVEQKLNKDSLDHQWKLKTVGNDYFWIINRNSGHYLSVVRGSKDNRNRIVQQPFSETNKNQQWGFSPVTLNRGNVFVRLVNRKDEQCISVHGKPKKEAPNVVMSPADESHNQHWQLVQVKSSSAKTKKDSVKSKGNKQPSALQGRWVSLWSNIGGKSDKIDKGNILVFKGDRLSWSFKKDVDPDVHPFVLDQKENFIDIKYAGHQENKPAKGLYRLKNDTLILCIAQAGEPRPKEIGTVNKEGETLIMYVLVRDKSK